MPAEARPRARRLPSGKWQLRYYDSKGGHRSGGAFSTKSEAWTHYRDVIEPELHGRPVARRDVTLTELVDTFLERHGSCAARRRSTRSAGVSSAPWTTTGTRRSSSSSDDRRARGFAANLPERYRYSVMSALRQACEAGVSYGYMSGTRRSWWVEPDACAAAGRVYTPKELERITGARPPRSSRDDFRGGTGLRPAEWANVERRDVDRARAGADRERHEDAGARGVRFH